MKKDLKINIVAFLLFFAVSATSILTLKLCNNTTLAFSVYYILQAAFFFTAASFDSLWGFCAYSSVALVLNFILPFPSYTSFILSALSTLPAIVVLNLLLNRLHAGTLVSFTGAAFLRYVIAHFCLFIARSSTSTHDYAVMEQLFGFPALISTLILTIILIFLYPAVKLAIGTKTDTYTEKTDVG